MPKRFRRLRATSAKWPARKPISRSNQPTEVALPVREAAAWNGGGARRWSETADYRDGLQSPAGGSRPLDRSVGGRRSDEAAAGSPRGNEEQPRSAGPPPPEA